MFLSVFDIFKVGIGPSSSHTMGPMSAAARFLEQLRKKGSEDITRIACSLHGSLAFTGHGHGTDRAVSLGLAGCLPETLDPDEAALIEARIRHEKMIRPAGMQSLGFNPEEDVIFDYGPALPGHANGMKFFGINATGEAIVSATYYSIGGGFVVSEKELSDAQAPNAPHPAGEDAKASGCPYPFDTAGEMLRMGRESGLNIAQMKEANELVFRSRTELEAGLDRIWQVMQGCVERGLKMEGELPGGLRVKRRARAIHQQLLEERKANATTPYEANEWLSVYAMAVNEENAAGGRVVTSPTNGAAGVIPAVVKYWSEHFSGATPESIREFLLTAAAIGGIIKHNASISGAEVGCQGEVGSASAMTAAGLCAVRGGSNEQIENAAEIALEHHLGMTCDPVAGLVQVPCIERNGFGAVKALTAANLALRGDGAHFVSLDNCIETMRQTGIDLMEKYKETSTGGLAVTVVEC